MNFVYRQPGSSSSRKWVKYFKFDIIVSVVNVEGIKKLVLTYIRSNAV